MAWSNVSDESLFQILAHAAAARAERKGIDLSVAVENTLCAAQRDFAIPVERLPSRSELTLMAAGLAQT